MSNQIEPQRVEVSDVRFWLAESFALFRRRALLFTAVSVVFFIVCHKLVMTSYITFLVGLILCQVCLVLSIIMARCVDESKPVSLTTCYSGLQNSVLATVLFSLFYVLMWVVAAKVASLFMFDEVIGEGGGPPPISFLQWLYPGTVGLFVVYIGVMVTTMWFLLPLTVFHQMGFIDALKLAKQGERINFPVVVVASYFPFFVFFGLFMVSELALVVAIFCMPLFGIYLYVAYRHVYLGRRENSPALVTKVVAESHAA